LEAAYTNIVFHKGGVGLQELLQWDS